MISDHSHFAGLVDAHLHFTGCLNPSCAAELANVSLVEAEAQLVPTEDAPKTLLSLISRFDLLDRVAWDESKLAAAIASVREQTKDLHGCWMRVSVDKYAQSGMVPSEVLSQIADGLPNARIVLAFRYEQQASWRLNLLNHPAVAGLDFVGNEHEFCTPSVCDAARLAVRKGCIVFAHVGETLTQEDTLWRIRMLASAGVRNICHGVRAFAPRPVLPEPGQPGIARFLRAGLPYNDQHVISDNEVVEALRDTGIWFHMAPSSNYWTGAWEDPDNHPAGWMADAGLKVTVGADDPAQCQCTTLSELDRFSPGTAARLAENARRHWIEYESSLGTPAYIRGADSLLAKY